MHPEPDRLGDHTPEHNLPAQGDFLGRCTLEMPNDPITDLSKQWGLGEIKQLSALVSAFLCSFVCLNSCFGECREIIGGNYCSM